MKYAEWKRLYGNKPMRIQPRNRSNNCRNSKHERCDMSYCECVCHGKVDKLMSREQWESSENE